MMGSTPPEKECGTCAAVHAKQEPGPYSPLKQAPPLPAKNNEAGCAMLIKLRAAEELCLEIHQSSTEVARLFDRLV